MCWWWSRMSRICGRWNGPARSMPATMFWADRCRPSMASARRTSILPR
ncbi:UNVERIFIED_CONTAM: hypothetical protein GTU68_006177 [Idotea baltica]|nr:hypothetical protein [Idotea baltica]